MSSPETTPATQSEQERRARGPRKLVSLLVVLVLAGAIGGLVWYKLFREVPTNYADDADLFKYGSIGNEAYDGIPYWLWLVLPRVFPEHLPGNGGYAALGMVWEEGHTLPDGSWKPSGEVPIGFSKKTIGFPRIAMNCAICHLSVVRKPDENVATLYPGGTGNQMNTQGYLRFLFACANDPRFTADILMPEIQYNVKLSLVDQLLYRYLLIPQTRKALLEQEKRYAFMSTRPDWSIGEIDPFNPVKFNVLGMDSATDDTVGNSDMEPIWNLQPREGMALHWDGLNTSIREVILSSAIGDGARAPTLPLATLERLENYLRKLPAPEYPFPVDQKLAARGKEIYQRTGCAECHNFGAKRTGTVIPVAEVGTDPERHKLWREEAARRYNNYAKDYPWKFNNFRATDGYASVPLDGVWIRAPFLHNGSVPSLSDLLEPPAKRPKVFYRGNNLYDPTKVGFVSDVAEEKGRRFFKYDTSLKANSNAGHAGATYGTGLSADDKTALVEYLKTL
jgi:hypothetical protein